MTIPTVASVRAWQPDVLWAAADGLSKAADTLDDQVNAVRKAMNAATVEWRGSTADAARERAGRELRDGEALVAAVRAMRDALLGGAGALGTARADLLVAIDGASASGFMVTDSGAVAVAPQPPVMTSPGGAAAAAAERDARQSELQCQLGGVGSAVAAALRRVIDTDQVIADLLNRIEIPSSMRVRVDQLLVSAADESAANSLLAWGAGGYWAMRTGIKGTSVLSKFRALVARDFTVLMVGQADGGPLRRVIGTPRAQLIGRAFLPLTVVSGVTDVITGGGYEGDRAWAARGFGLAGATGAAGLMAAGGMLGPGAIGLMAATGPVGLGVAGAAVVAYGAWELGNLVYDHHEAIGEFASKTVEWTGAGIGAAGDWAGDRMGDVAGLGKKLLPDVAIPDLNPF